MPSPHLTYALLYMPSPHPPPTSLTINPNSPLTFNSQVLITAFISVRMMEVKRSSILQDVAEVTLPEALRWLREMLSRGRAHPDLAAGHGSAATGQSSGSLFGRGSRNRVAAERLEKPGMEGGAFGPASSASSAEGAGAGTPRAARDSAEDAGATTPRAAAGMCSGSSGSCGKDAQWEAPSAELQPGGRLGFLKQPSSTWLQSRLRSDVLHGLHKPAPSIRVYAIQLGGMYYEVAALHGVILTMLRQHRSGQNGGPLGRTRRRAFGEPEDGSLFFPMRRRAGPVAEARGGDEDDAEQRGGRGRGDGGRSGRGVEGSAPSGIGMEGLASRKGSSPQVKLRGSSAASLHRASRSRLTGSRQVSYAGFDIDLARSSGSVTSRKGSTFAPERSQASAATLLRKGAHMEEVHTLQQRALGGGLQISRTMLAQGSDPLLLRRASTALLQSFAAEGRMRWTLRGDDRGFARLGAEVQSLMVAQGMHLMLAQGFQIR